MNALQLERFLCQLREKLRTERAGRRQSDLLTAPAFTTFDYIEPDELTISRIVAALLRTDGKHGQGSAFLAEFLKAVGVPADISLENVRVETETSTAHIPNSRKRVDILIDLVTFGLGIENKVFGAQDQPGQLRDYARDLEVRFQGRFLLLYLSYDGTSPASESLMEEERKALEVTGKLVIKPCATFLKRWLEGCAGACKAENVRWFLRDFSTCLDSLSAGGKGEGMPTKGDRELIVSYAMRTRDDLETALRIGAQFDSIRKKVIGQFGQGLADCLHKSLGGSWRIDNRGLFEKQAGIRFSKSEWPKDWWVEIASDTGEGRSMYVGIRNTGNPAINEQIKQRLDLLRRGKVESQWPWYFYLRPPYMDWNKPDLLVRMYEGDAELRDKLAEEVHRVLAVAEPAIEEAIARAQSQATPPKTLPS